MNTEYSPSIAIPLRCAKITMELIKVLVVDDSICWRDFVLRYFETKTGYKITGVAVNGLEAVQKADQLRPDVILMDINLPGIDGIEATRQICNSYPGSKIVFVSMLADSEIVEAAFDVGGSGYILKHNFAQDLFSGIRAALDGRQFASRSLPRR
jgi:DNA-binding NarL/FixJ family response regulator